jgi:hypothetical protein
MVEEQNSFEIYHSTPFLSMTLLLITACLVRSIPDLLEEERCVRLAFEAKIHKKSNTCSYSQLEAIQIMFKMADDKNVWILG